MCIRIFDNNDVLNMVSVQCAVCSMQCASSSMQYAVCGVQCTLHWPLQRSVKCRGEERNLQSGVYMRQPTKTYMLRLRLLECYNLTYMVRPLKYYNLTH